MVRRFRNQRGFIDILMGAALLSATFAAYTYMNLNTLQTARISYASRARAAATRANESAITLVNRLFESGVLVVDWSSNGFPALSMPTEPYSLANRNWIYTPYSVGPPAVPPALTMTTCNAGTLDPAARDSLFDAGVIPSCAGNVLTTTLEFEEVNVPSNYAIVRATTGIKLYSANSGIVGLTLRARIALPNRCDGQDTGYQMTASKKPRKIRTADDWARMTDGEHYVVENDVTFPGTAKPARALKNVVIDGDFKKLRNFDFSDPSAEGVGQFSEITCGRVRDIAIDSPSPRVTSGAGCVGGLVGIARQSFIKGVSFFGDVRGVNGVGTIVGCMDDPGTRRSTIEDSFSDAFVGMQPASFGGSTCTTKRTWFDPGGPGPSGYRPGDANGQACCDPGSDSCNAGGIAGVFSGQMTNVYMQGEIHSTTTTQPHSVGGIAGNLDATNPQGGATNPAPAGFAQVQSAFAKVNIIMEQPSLGSRVGGLVGQMTGGLIEKSSSNSDVLKGGPTPGRARLVGGIVGRMTNGTIRRSYAEQRDNGSGVWYGNVVGTDNVGGIVGQATNSLIQHTYNNDFSVSCTGSNCAGIAGRASGSTFDAVWANNVVSGTDPSTTGAFVGAEPGAANSYTQVAGVDTTLYNSERNVGLPASGTGPGAPAAHTFAEMTSFPSVAFPNPPYTPADYNMVNGSLPDSVSNPSVPPQVPLEMGSGISY